MNSNAWDKLLLIVVGVAVLALSGMFVVKALGFGETFFMETSTPDDTLPPTDVARCKIAKDFVTQTQLWATPEKGAGPKPVPLFVSIPIVESDGKMIDMLDPNAPKLRPPVTNAWLMNNNLDYLNSNVLEMDSDDDGFSNIEEWDEKTDPIDAASHPAYADKLVMVSRQQTNYQIRFSGRPDSERFQITRMPGSDLVSDAPGLIRDPKFRRYPRDDFYLRVGDTSEDGRIRLESFEEKRARNSSGIEVDATTLKITYVPKNETHEIVLRVDHQIPTYFAELEFLLDPGNKFFVKEGDTFNLVLDPDTKYRVTKVEEETTSVSYQTGTEPEQTVEIKKK